MLVARHELGSPFWWSQAAPSVALKRRLIPVLRTKVLAVLIESRKDASTLVCRASLPQNRTHPRLRGGMLFHRSILIRENVRWGAGAKVNDEAVAVADKAEFVVEFMGAFARDVG